MWERAGASTPTRQVPIPDEERTIMTKATRNSGNSLLAETELASRLVEAGMPVYCSTLDRNGFPHRKGWTDIRPDLAEVRSWRPGKGLLAITGIVYDVWDYDPRNDPDGSGLAEFGEFMEQANPVIYLRVSTRSGGWHWYTAALGERKAKTRFRGVDYQGGGACVFIPPTVRRSKEDPEPRGYEAQPEDAIGEPLEVCDKLRKGLVKAESNGHGLTEPVREMIDAEPGDRNEALRDGVWKLMDSGVDLETVIQMTAPALRERGWKARNGTLENDIRDIASRNQNKPLTDEERRLIREPGWEPKISRRKPGRKAPDGKELLAGMRNGTWLDSQEFAPLEYAVPGLLPEGVVLLVGPPKAGKSTIIRRIGLESARGGKVFGIKCERRSVLYLALEDDDPSMQASCWELLGEDDIPARFHYLTEIKPGMLIPTVAAFLDKYTRSLVVVDTLGRAMDPQRRGETQYDRDYRILTDLKSMAKNHPGSTIVVNHHSRKAKSEDFVDMVSGTNALAGGADTIVVLFRRRGSADGMWKATSRKPMDDAEYALILERPFGWRLNGKDLEEATANAVTAMTQKNLGGRSIEAINYVSAHPEGVTLAQIAEATGIPPNQLKYYISTAAERGDILKIKRGLYGPSGPIRINGK